MIKMTIKKSKNYWEKRAERQEKKVYKEGDKLLKELDKNLNNARKEIQKSINDLVARYMELTELSYTDAMRNLTSSEFKEWRMTLEEYMAEIKKFKGIDEDISNKLKLELETLAMKSRISRLDTLKAQIDMELNRKAYIEQEALKGTLETVYNDSYREIRLDFEVESSVAYLDTDTLSDLINYPWSGTDFSNRIWENRAALGRVLKEEIIQSFIQGISVKDLSDKIMGRMNSDRKNTERLVRTELNYALNQATKKGYEDSEVEEYEYLAEIDSRTSPQCRELNGKVFKLEDAKVGVNYPPMHPHCYDRETEIFTNQGWKLFKDLTKEELVYTLDKDTLIPEWQKPINYITYNYKGKLLYYKNSRFDLMVTPEHRLLVQNKDSSVKDKSWKLKKANTVGKKSKNRMLSGINWKGINKKSETLANKKVPIEIYLKFMAYWLADGSYTKDRGSYNIKISQYENDWMYEELKELPFKIYKCKESLMIHNKELGDELKKFGKCTEKYIPENIKELSPELIRIFLMAYAKTDGHIKRGKEWKGYQFDDSIVFFTTSDKLASDLGELILKAGGRPSYYLNKIQGKEIEFRNGKYTINKDCWVISWNKQVHTWLSSLEITEINYDDNVYCVEVPKHNTVLVRRNGKICWSGNCRSTTIPVIEYEKLKEPEKNGIIKVENKKIEETMEPQDYNNYMNLINNNSNKDIQRLYYEYSNDISSIKRSLGGGTYSPLSNAIDYSYPREKHVENGVSKYSTLAHEFGHYFDNREFYNDLSYKEVDTLNSYFDLGKRKIFKDSPSSSDEFLIALQKDREFLKTAFKESRADIISTDASGGVQDALDGMFGTQDKRLTPWGHGDAYYNRKYNKTIKALHLEKELKEIYVSLGFTAKNQAQVKELCRRYETASEAWANICSAVTCGGKELEYTQKYLPNMYETFLKIIKNVKKGDVK